ncbi:MAG: hypothetical protein M1829_000146 [Trizodia sp. TS-e1964]|nr:MAG: hypothetical protein M1829_000146 [Trizodia sp. TS-e1964]
MIPQLKKPGTIEPEFHNHYNMTSKFVSAGTIDTPLERDEEWKQAQEELEATRRRKATESRAQDGKSLYETLQANKAAKQEAFEESLRLKNQFRTLDDDEVEFLDAVLESTRAREALLKRETSEQLEAFRLRREEAEQAALEEEGARVRPASPVEEEWGGARKRRRRAEVIPGLKVRRVVAASPVSLGVEKEKKEGDLKESGKLVAPVEGEKLPARVSTSSLPKPSAATGGGLLGLDYSDSDD